MHTIDRRRTLAAMWLTLACAGASAGLAFAVPEGEPKVATTDVLAAPAANLPAATPAKKPQWKAPSVVPVAGSLNRVELVPTDQQVSEAMQKAVTYLLSKKKDDNFETHDKPWPGKNDGGETAIVTYALLHAGRSMNDSRIGPTSTELKPVLKYLANLEQDGTYSAGLTALALSFNPKTPENKKAFRKCYDYLARAMNRDPKNVKENGGFWYNAPPSPQDLVKESQKKVDDLKVELATATKSKDQAAVKSASEKLTAAQKDLAAKSKAGKKIVYWGQPDGSNTQYGVLGLWAMADYGVEVPDALWTQMDGYWRKNQLADGGWAYNAGSAVKGSTDTMSIAGLASLFITEEFLDTQIRLEPQADPIVDKALDHVAQNFTANGNLYYMYGAARVGLASGLKFFGTKNWYRQGASQLLRSQNPGNGSWSQFSDTVGTAYGLLFLARGRNPVPFNKLQYDGPWNARPRDDANLAEWLGKGYEKEFNWQVVSTQVEPEEWMDAPILLITGSKDLDFKPEERAKIKKFVDMGGMVFSTSDGGGGAFDKSVRKLMKELYPAYPAALLKKESALLDGELGTQPIKELPKVVAVSNGARYLWVHTEEDMGASWQKRTYTKTSHFVFPLNLYFYAVGLNTSRTKLDDPVVHVGNKKPTDSLAVAKLALGDNADPEPFAWERMKLLSQADRLTDLTVTSRKATELGTATPALVTFTGCDKFKASADEVAALQSYLNGGGTMLADALGGSKAFTSSFLELAKALYPQGNLEEVAQSDPMFSGLGEVGYRRYSKKLHGRAGDWKSVRLRGIKDHGRWVVIFSEYDLTSGLLGTETWGIDGYTADAAEAIVKHVLDYVKTSGKKGG